MALTTFQCKNLTAEEAKSQSHLQQQQEDDSQDRTVVSSSFYTISHVFRLLQQLQASLNQDINLQPDKHTFETPQNCFSVVIGKG